MKQPYDAIRLVISNIGAGDDAEAWRAFLAAEGWTVGAGWGTDDVVAWADRRNTRTVPTRRTLLQVLRDRHAAAGHDPAAVVLSKGEAVVDLTYYRAVDRK
ncbi:hypothetical protein [Urbifossiella limnaea]|uniref:Uncharacterized protein n=1 Tax=Urbifossiella limnaea TaxID=2528023 RepID=A0A517XW68_9BACT|nr:hypothetical protein [Urbifossiella limnaea]QDU21750.1 hypothetical protein ETAA1_37230 [Urbifossiella limnaea]